MEREATPPRIRRAGPSRPGRSARRACRPTPFRCTSLVAYHSRIPHDGHFLSRLDRVSVAQTEFALALYRDHELVRLVLEELRLPEAVERVALSLDDPNDGPFVLVARDGAFVTCLGKGMSPEPHPVVTRSRLDALAGKVHALRERLELARDLAGPKRAADELFGRIFRAGDELSREDVLALSAFTPLLGNQLLLTASDVDEDLLRASNGAHLLKKPTSRQIDALRAAWSLLYSLGHIVVLLGMGDRRLLDHLPAGDDRRAALSWLTSRHAIVALALRGAWAVGRFGKPMLGAYKRAFDVRETRLELADAALAIGAIAQRHSSVRAEVRKALSPLAALIRDTEADPSESHTLDELLERARGSFAGLVLFGLDEPDRCARFQLQLGRSLAYHAVVTRRPSDPPRFASADEVPETFAIPMAVTDEGNPLAQRDAVAAMFLLLPWVARANGPDLYLPREQLRLVRHPWDPARAAELLTRVQRASPPPEPARSSKVGRNEPCPCGSGKKVKRCCAA